jgi:hypothetical protein
MAPFDYNPVVLLKPFRPHLAVGALPSDAILHRPVRHYPHVWISARGLGPSGTLTHLKRLLPGTHYDAVRLPAVQTMPSRVTAPMHTAPVSDRASQVHTTTLHEHAGGSAPGGQCSRLLDTVAFAAFPINRNGRRPHGKFSISGFTLIHPQDSACSLAPYSFAGRVTPHRRVFRYIPACSALGWHPFQRCLLCCASWRTGLKRNLPSLTATGQ